MGGLGSAERWKIGWEPPIIRHRAGALPAVVAGLLGLAAAGGTLPFASVEAGWRALLQVVGFAAFATAVAVAPSLRGLRHARLPLAALAGIAVLGVLQAAPLPASAVRLLSPHHHRLQERAAELAGSEAVAASLSLAADVSRTSALQWLAVAAFFGAAAAVSGGRLRRRWIAGSLIAVAGFQVLYGTRRWLAGAGTIWGVDVPGGAGPAARLRGTYVNPNHLATLLILVLPLVFAWGWVAWRRAARSDSSAEMRVALVAPPLLVWMALLVALAFTGSRSALAAGLVAVVFQGLLAAAAARRWRLAPIGLLAALVGVGLVAAIGFQQGLGRLLGTSAYEIAWGARTEAYRATLELWGRFPWTGTGLGTFREAFPLVQPADLGGLWRHAHSDWLELLATTGVVGALLFGVGLAGLLARLRRVVLWGYRSEDRAAGLASLGVVAALAVQEALDFGLTIPANAVAAAVVLGAATAAKTVPRSSAADRERPAPRRLS